MAQQLRIFFSSPGDVTDERRRAALVISRLRREFVRFFELSAVLWEYEPMLSSGHFQDIIEPPSDADIVVLILWSRLGTPLPQRTSLREYRGRDGHAPVPGTGSRPSQDRRVLSADGAVRFGVSADACHEIFPSTSPQIRFSVGAFQYIAASRNSLQFFACARRSPPR